MKCILSFTFQLILVYSNGNFLTEPCVIHSQKLSRINCQGILFEKSKSVLGLSLDVVSRRSCGFYFDYSFRASGLGCRAR
jgi:hypothetical protein